MKYPELPKGVASYYLHGEDDYRHPSQHPDTICLLVRASTKNGNKLPDTVSKWEILSAGICFLNPKDHLEFMDWEKAEVISLGRALKMYHKTHISANVKNFTISWAKLPSMQ